jgi:hypothetical protein
VNPPRGEDEENAASPPSLRAKKREKKWVNVLDCDAEDSTEETHEDEARLEGFLRCTLGSMVCDRIGRGGLWYGIRYARGI